MTVDEIKFIAKQHRGYGWLNSLLDKPWVTNELLHKSLEQIEGAFRDRLILAIGVERKNLGQLMLPKQHGGYLKPGYEDACNGIKAALTALHNRLRALQRQQDIESDAGEKDTPITCILCREIEKKYKELKPIQSQVTYLGRWQRLAYKITDLEKELEGEKPQPSKHSRRSLTERLVSVRVQYAKLGPFTDDCQQQLVHVARALDLKMAEYHRSKKEKHLRCAACTNLLGPGHLQATWVMVDGHAFCPDCPKKVYPFKD